MYIKNFHGKNIIDFKIIISERIFAMNNLTTKELGALEEQLNQEKLMVKKYQELANCCQDQQLKQKCQEIAMKHQSHYNSLLSHLN